MYFLNQMLRLLLISCTWSTQLLMRVASILSTWSLFWDSLPVSTKLSCCSSVCVFFYNLYHSILKVVSKERFLTTSVVLAIQMILINSWYENVYSDQVWLLIEGSHYFTHKMDVGGYFLRTGTNWGWRLIKEIWYMLFFYLLTGNTTVYVNHALYRIICHALCTFTCMSFSSTQWILFSNRKCD